MKKRFYTAEEMIAFRLGESEFLKIMRFRYPNKAITDILKEYYHLKWLRQLHDLEELFRPICSNCEYWEKPKFNEEDDVYLGRCTQRRVTTEGEASACEFFELEKHPVEDKKEMVEAILEKIHELRDEDPTVQERRRTKKEQEK